MCSSFCPCKASSKEEEYYALTREQTDAKNREEGLDWVFGGFVTPIGSPEQKTQGVPGVDFYEKDFSSWAECMKEGATRTITEENRVFVEKAKEFVYEDGKFYGFL